MEYVLIFTGIVLSYLLGSIPSAVWIGKTFYKVDVRNLGSGNSGATNTMRTLGKKAGIAVLLIDIFKGVAAILMAYLFTNYSSTDPRFINYQIICGLVSVMGHIFPVFADFRGGKGIATLAGILFALNPSVAGVVVCIFILIFMLTKYVSLSSITAAFSYPLIMYFLFNIKIESLIVFAFMIAVLVPLSHYKNIVRLIKGEETKMDLLRSKK